MSYDSEKNHVKVTRYRTRKGLRDLGYEEDEIETILSQYDWTITTASTVLQRYGTNPPEQSPARAAHNQVNQEPPEQSEKWAIPVAIGGIVAAFIGLLVMAKWLNGK